MVPTRITATGIFSAYLYLDGMADGRAGVYRPVARLFKVVAYANILSRAAILASEFCCVPMRDKTRPGGNEDARMPERLCSEGVRRRLGGFLAEGARGLYKASL